MLANRQRTISYSQMLRLVLVGLILMATCSILNPLHRPLSLAVTTRDTEQIHAPSSTLPLVPLANQTADTKNPANLTQSAAFPAGLYPTWLASQQASTGPEYAIAQTASGAWEANNPAHNLQTVFSEEGLKLNGTWSLALSEVGYQGQPLQQIGTSTEPQAIVANRIEYQRQAGLVEWYVNGPLGLEQGFTIAQPWPNSRQETSEWLDLELQLAGGKAVNLVNQAGETSNSQSWLTIQGPGEQLLGRYGGLYAYDASGRRLESKLEIVGQEAQTIRLSVKTQGASYPLVIDPFIQQTQLVAGNGVANDYFGASVSLSNNGNTALVGASGKNNNKGTAYVFTRNGTVWSELQEILHSDGVANDNFGYTVSLSGDGNTAFIGAPGKNNNRGAVYIFLCSGNVWGQLQMLTTSDEAVGDNFGYAVSLSNDGDTAIVGAFQKTIGANTMQGAAYVFTRSGTVWSQQQRLTANDGAATDWFGYTVSLSNDGNIALIGAVYQNIGSNNRQGAVYAFTRSGTTWNQQQKLTNSDGAAYDHFGWSVSLSNDSHTALIGAYSKNIGPTFDRGAAYVFTRLGTTWSEQQELSANDGMSQDEFGYSVGLSSDGNTALISAANKNSNQGAAYVFIRDGTNWSQQQEISDTNGVAHDWFGYAVSLSGDGNTALIGALDKAVGNNSKQGAAFVFSLLKTGSTTSLVSAPNPSSAGQSVVFTATVNPITATGTVRFKEGNITLGTATPDASGVATFTTSNLPAGSHVISATYGGDINLIASSSSPVTQVVTACSLPLLVTSNADDGTCGTLRSEVASATNGENITITLAADSVISLTSGTGLIVPHGATIHTTAACDANGPTITIQGVGPSSGDGLVLSGQNSLYNLWIRGFTGRQLVALGGGNSLSCIRATKT